MSNKAQAAWHGTECDGACCRTNRHLGVCPHYRVCTFHLREEVQRIKAEKEAIAAMEFRKAWI
jgi:hypothetical protein